MKISRWLKVTNFPFEYTMYCDGNFYSEQRDANKEIKYVNIRDGVISFHTKGE